MAYLEIYTQRIKQLRLEEEIARKKEEEEEKKQRERAVRKAQEFRKVQSLLLMASRLYQANILRDYLSIYEEFLKDKENEKRKDFTEEERNILQRFARIDQPYS